MEDLHELLKRKTVSIRFERTMGLFSATTIGLGALLGAGLYVLIGLAASKAGPAVWLAYLLCGGLAFLTTLMFADLARIIPKSGGGYAYAYAMLGSLGGFAAGWFLALGSIFACALYAIGFAQYFGSALGYVLPTVAIKIIALLLVAGSTWLNLRGSEGGQRIQILLTWGNIGILAALITFSFPEAKADYAFPMFPNGLSGVGGAIAIIYLSFFGYQLIANNSDEIIDPTNTVPRAMILAMLISIVIYLAIACMAITVIPWQELAASDAPLVLVATQSFGGNGWIIISLGGILASASALNSTILSQARQIYAMGKDRFLPTAIGSIHEISKTPRIALLAGGVGVGIALWLDLEFIAKSANFCLLVSLLPVSLALRHYYQKNPEALPQGRWTAWRRYLPEITFITNIGLLMTLDMQALLFGLQLAFVGAIIFVFYSRRREVRARASMHVVLSDESKMKTGLGKGGLRILMPSANPNTQQAMLSLANACIGSDKDGEKKGEIMLLLVVNSLEQADESLHLVQQGKELAAAAAAPIYPVLRVGKSISKGIVHAAEEESCNLILMGYGGGDAMKSARLMENILKYAGSDVLFCKLKNPAAEFSPRKIAIAIDGRSNLDLMTKVAGAVAEHFLAVVVLVNILPPDFSEKQMETSKNNMMQAMQSLSHRVLFQVKTLHSNNPLEAMVKQSANYDLLIIGATRAGILEHAIVGPFSTQLSEKSHCAVAVVREASTAEKIMSSI
ncbi:MAG: amino acid permease [Mariprofundales bacterium]